MVAAAQLATSTRYWLVAAKSLAVSCTGHNARPQCTLATLTCRSHSSASSSAETLPTGKKTGQLLPLRAHSAPSPQAVVMGWKTAAWHRLDAFVLAKPCRNHRCRKCPEKWVVAGATRATAPAGAAPRGDRLGSGCRPSPREAAEKSLFVVPKHKGPASPESSQKRACSLPPPADQQRPPP